MKTDIVLEKELEVEQKQILKQKKKKDKHNFRSIYVYKGWNGETWTWKNWHSNLEAAQLSIKKRRKLWKESFISYQILNKNNQIIQSG